MADIITDLLLGIGDFEVCHYTQTDIGTQYGDVPSDNFRVADGWIGVRTAGHLSDCVFDIVDSVTYSGPGAEHLEPGLSYQYAAYATNATDAVTFQVYTSVRTLSGYEEETFAPSDALTFQIDKIIATSATLAEGTNRSLTLQMAYTTIEAPNTWVTTHAHINIPDIDVPYENATITLNADHTLNLKQVNLYVNLYLNLEASAPHTYGLLFTGAHLWVTKAGESSYKTESDVLPVNRNIKVQSNWVDFAYIPPRVYARNYDRLVSPAHNYPYFATLRSINPDIKIYIYQGAGDIQHSTLRPARWCVTPLKMAQTANDNAEDYGVVAEHPEWLFPIVGTPTFSGLYHDTYEDAGYADRFWTSGITDPVLHAEFTRRIINVTKSVDADGVFFDTLTGLVAANVEVDRAPWEIQNFLHGVIPTLQASGIDIQHNQALVTLDGSVSTWSGDVGVIYHNPTWVPTETYPISAGYSANSVATVPEVFFREYTFIRNDLIYSSSYWLKCINDPEILRSWCVTSGTPRYIVCQVSQTTITGTESWIPFTLASYLLCQNDYTIFEYLCYDEAGNTVELDVDYSVTVSLGIPDGLSVAIDDDPYFRYRLYESDGPNALGGVVVVNGNTEVSLSGIFDFFEGETTVYASVSQTGTLSPGDIFGNGVAGYHTVVSLAMGGTYINISDTILAENSIDSTSCKKIVYSDFTVPFDVIDEDDNLISAGTVVPIASNSGKIFLNNQAAGITLNKATLSLINGASETLIATISPATTVNKAVTWSSSNNAVATVDISGLVIAQASGTCVITATSVDSGLTATCIVISSFTPGTAASIGGLGVPESSSLHVLDVNVAGADPTLLADVMSLLGLLGSDVRTTSAISMTPSAFVQTPNPPTINNNNINIDINATLRDTKMSLERFLNIGDQLS